MDFPENGGYPRIYSLATWLPKSKSIILSVLTSVFFQHLSLVDIMCHKQAQNTVYVNAIL
jgi:hypothetical protein